MNDDALAEAYNRGLEREKAGDLDAAAAAYRAALALDPADPGGVSVRLAAIGRGAAPPAAPPAYVATLFDQHAEMFDHILVDQLGYAVPMTARERFQALGLGPFERMLDLGCGTGLAAEALEDMSAHRTGVDLAEGMIEMAGEKELYDALFVGEAVRFLEQADEAWDLVIATDVFPYLGDARALVSAAGRRTAPGGLFAFSTETQPGMTADWAVGRHHRYAHRLGYVEAELAAAGFAMLEATDITVRHEEGAPIPGHLVLARR